MLLDSCAIYYIDFDSKCRRISDQEFKQIGLDSVDGCIANSSIKNRLYITQADDKSIYISRSIGDLKKIFNESLSINKDAKYFYIRFGFIYPPFTLYSDVYLMAPHVLFSIDYLGRLHFKSKLKPYTSNSSMERVVNATLIKQEIERVVRLEAETAVDEEVSTDVLFSGGIDSSAILGVLKDVGIINSAITCNMPSLSSEISKSSAMAKLAKVEQLIIDIPKDLEFETNEFIDKTHEPIQDSIAPVLVYCFNYLKAKSPNRKYIIVDGQGADSLLSGLPHDKVYSVYKRLSRFKRLKSILRLIPSHFPRNISRRLYRVLKALNAVSQKDVKSFLEVTLVEDHSMQLKSTNSVLGFMRNEFDLLSRCYEDFHKGIRYIFLFRVLPAREMQKYLSIPQNVKVILPFLDDDVVKEFFNAPTSELIKGNVYKYPMFNLASEYFPEHIKSSATSPFAVFYEAGGTNIKDFSLIRIDSL